MGLSLEEFYKGRRVFVTGHTGFKGSWLCHLLLHLGAEVTGYSELPPTDPSIYELTGLADRVRSVIGDVRDGQKLKDVMREAEPDIVLHLAAQPIVRESYRNPVYTYETNVMGTVNVLEAVRAVESVQSFLNVTTDKVYQNNEWEWGYRETDPLDGYDPYSNSKSCSELVTHSYQKSFFADGRCAISTARAGNVIGGGDFAADRIIPDCVRSALSGTDVTVRNPYSIRPYQHVLEPLCAYLLITMRQYEDHGFSGYYNVGPDDRDCVTTGQLTDCFCKCWGNGMRWIDRYDGGPHEANFLKLDCSRIKSVFGWKSVWSVSEAVARTVEWSKCYEAGGDVTGVMVRQISDYLRAFDYS